MPTRNGVQSNLRFIPILGARTIGELKSRGIIGKMEDIVKVKYRG
jgi:hypothetical protein